MKLAACIILKLYYWTCQYSYLGNRHIYTCHSIIFINIVHSIYILSSWFGCHYITSTPTGLSHEFSYAFRLCLYGFSSWGSEATALPYNTWLLCTWGANKSPEFWCAQDWILILIFSKILTSRVASTIFRQSVYIQLSNEQNPLYYTFWHVSTEK
jgi:hypothetical protein